MNILIVGSSTERDASMKTLLELTFPRSYIIEHSISELHSIGKKDLDRLDIIVCIFPSETLEYIHFFQKCTSYSVPILCIVKSLTQALYSKLLNAGVRGVVDFESPFDNVRNIIRIVKEGGMYIDPVIANQISNPHLTTSRTNMGKPTLSNMQWEIFKAFADGYGLEEIVKLNNLDKRVILSHQNIIMQKTNTKTISGAVAQAIYQGWFY